MVAVRTGESGGTGDRARPPPMAIEPVARRMARGEWRDPRLGRVTLAEWVTSYLDGAGHKRATTRARDEVVLRKHFLPALGSRPIGSITPLDIRRVVETMAETLAPATVRTNYAVLKAVLNAAVEADLLVKSPCRGARLHAARKKERAELSPENLDRL